VRDVAVSSRKMPVAEASATPNRGAAGSEGSISQQVVPPDKSVLLELAEVSFSYANGLQAVAGLSVSVRRGGRLGIVGPSGCGKSTLLRLISGLEEPGGGEVIRNFETQPDRAAVTMVLQENTLLPWLTVRKNVGLYFLLRPSVLSKREINDRIDQLLHMVGLEAFADAFPRQLSGGMKRRVAFLAAIAPRPQLLLLDEPFSSVDEPTRVEIHQQVRSILDEFEITTVLVTHDLAEAVSLTDTVAILSARPAHVARVTPVALDGASDLLELRGSAEFLETYGHLWEALSHEIRAGRAGTGAAADGRPGGSRPNGSQLQGNK
jgi:ABC-type nitrate/sulfonate/bicarbonate transport system ATPase subunit